MRWIFYRVIANYYGSTVSFPLIHVIRRRTTISHVTIQTWRFASEIKWYWVVYLFHHSRINRFGGYPELLQWQARYFSVYGVAVTPGIKLLKYSNDSLRGPNKWEKLWTIININKTMFPYLYQNIYYHNKQYMLRILLLSCIWCAIPIKNVVYLFVCFTLKMEIFIKTVVKYELEESIRNRVPLDYFHVLIC